MRNQSILFFLVLCLFASSCKTSKPKSSEPLTGIADYLSFKEEKLAIVSAHRGGPAKGYPENALETIQHTIDEVPAIVEIDVAKTKDGKLILMHDNSLDRTTTGTGKVTSKTWKDIQQLFLKDKSGTVTSYKVPLFSEVLEWSKGKAILTVDVKRSVPIREVIEAIEDADALSNTVVITYSASQAEKVYEINDEIMISVGMRNFKEYYTIRDIGIPAENLIAFTGTRKSEDDLFKLIHNDGILCIFGTMGNLDKSAAKRGGKVYTDLINQGVDVIATDRPLQAWKAIKGMCERNTDYPKTN